MVKMKKIAISFFMILIISLPFFCQNFFLLNLNILGRNNKDIQLTTLSWHENGNPVCVNTGVQISNYMITNENGSIFIIWRDQRNEAYGGDIYGQLINPDGNIQWETNGKALINAVGLQDPKGIIYSGVNCAIYVWEDNRTGNFDIYAQKINLTSRNSLWENNGTVICNASNDQKAPKLITDGNGGAIVTWIDERGGSSTLFVQKINSTGIVQWNANGTLICNKTNSIINSPQITVDGLNGSIITWRDNRTGNNSIYCQRINSVGDYQWTLNGTAILNVENLTISNLGICSDGLNGSIITWTDNRTNNTFKVFAQRINSTGYSEWLSNGTPICNKTLNLQDEVKIIEDGANGTILVWTDFRNGLTDSNIYAQKLNSTGKFQWDENGTAICLASGYQKLPQITSDGYKGAILTWLDLRLSNRKRIYAQRIDQTGRVNWTENGILICSQEMELKSIVIAFDKNNASYITWIDYRELINNGDIYIQRILNNGELLFSTPIQITPIFPEAQKTIFQQIWFYMLIFLIVIDCVLVYFIIKKREDGEKIIERKA